MAEGGKLRQQNSATDLRLVQYIHCLLNVTLLHLAPACNKYLQVLELITATKKTPLTVKTIVLKYKESLCSQYKNL